MVFMVSQRVRHDLATEYTYSANFSPELWWKCTRCDIWSQDWVWILTSHFTRNLGMKLWVLLSFLHRVFQLKLPWPHFLLLLFCFNLVNPGEIGLHASWVSSDINLSWKPTLNSQVREVTLFYTLHVFYQILLCWCKICTYESK